MWFIGIDYTVCLEKTIFKFTPFTCNKRVTTIFSRGVRIHRRPYVSYNIRSGEIAAYGRQLPRVEGDYNIQRDVIPNGRRELPREGGSYNIQRGAKPYGRQLPRAGEGYNFPRGVIPNKRDFPRVGGGYNIQWDVIPNGHQTPRVGGRLNTLKNIKPTSSFVVNENRLAHNIVKLYPNGFRCNLKAKYNVEKILFFANINKLLNESYPYDLKPDAIVTFQERKKGVFICDIRNTSVKNNDIVNYQFIVYLSGKVPSYSNCYSHKMVVKNIVDLVQ